MNALESLGYQATRAADTALGASASAAESVAGVVRDPRRELDRLRGDLDANVRRFERRGAQARKRAVREVNRRRDGITRTVRRGRRDVEQQVDATRRDFKSTTEGFATRVQETAERLT